MTTNYQRALDLADHIADVDESPRELVKQLHQLELLAPDLPKPNDNNEFQPSRWNIVYLQVDDGAIFLYSTLRQRRDSRNSAHKRARPHAHRRS